MIDVNGPDVHFLISVCRSFYAFAATIPTHFALHHHLQSSYSVHNIKMSMSSYKGIVGGKKKTFYLKTHFMLLGWWWGETHGPKTLC